MCFLLWQLITGFSGKPYNYSDFEVVMNRNDILKYLLPSCNGVASTMVAYCLHS